MLLNVQNKWDLLIKPKIQSICLRNECHRNKAKEFSLCALLLYIIIINYNPKYTIGKQVTELEFNMFPKRAHIRKLMRHKKQVPPDTDKSHLIGLIRVTFS